MSKLFAYALSKKDPATALALSLEMQRIEKVLETKITNKILNNMRGKDGYTPVLGRDYYTESDIKKIVNYISSKIRVPEDGKKGEKGKDGKNGKDGYTPIAGKDYPNEKEVLKIVNTEVSALFASQSKKNITRDEVQQLIGKIQHKIDWKEQAQEIARALESIKIDKEKLDYNALKNKPEVPSNNTIDSRVRGILRGGGDRIRVHELTGTGATKTFTVPTHKRALLVISTDFPILLKSTVDFTTSGTILTLTDAVPTPISGASIAFLYVE